MAVISSLGGCGLLRSARFIAGVAVGIGLTSLGGALLGQGFASARQPLQPGVETLISTSKTIVGEPIVYPSGTAKITAAIITLPVGASTGWHSHEVPLFGYILDGELTVDYGESGVRTYRPDDGFMEAINIAHNGHNAGNRDVRILAVYMSAEGLELSHKAVAPPK